MLKGTKYVTKGLALALAAALLVSGCGKPAETGSEPAGQGNEISSEETRSSGADTANAKSQSTDDLALLLRAKYDAGTVDYSGDTISVDREEAIQIKLGFDPYTDASVDFMDSFIVYQDAELKYPIGSSSYDWDESTGMLTIEPPYGPASDFEMEIDHVSTPLLEGSDKTGWGNLPQLYLQTKVDVETGAPITGKPLVTVVKVNAELSQAPQVKFGQDEEGYARFSWKEVPGAEEYLLFSISDYEGVLNSYINVFAATTDTEWTVEPSMSIDGTEVITINDMFSKYIYDALEDEDEETDDGYGEMNEYIGVIAVSSTGSSHISNLFNSEDLAHMLPYSVAYSENKETNGISCTGTLNLPTNMGITMCDGSISQRIIEYDMDSIEKAEDSAYYMISCKAYGTPFVDEFLVTDQDWDTLEQELADVQERQEKLKNKGGNVEADISFLDGEDTKETPDTPQTEEAEEEEAVTEEVPEAAPEEEKPEEEVIDEDIPAEEPQEEDMDDGTQTTEVIDYEDGKITANSALSEYLAIHMLNSNEEIDISAFPEAADTALVVDAFMEAQYQNPLILGIKEVGMDTLEKVLYIGYDDDADTTEAKRKELEEKVAEITSEIISDGMSDLDKELAINTYLCDNAVYDDGALESAAENDFKYVDEIYNDSFTAYGVLVNNVGVCASYSAAFKLLADAAGLESIVVTGYLEGNLPHAWNKVKLDGAWNIVDATNNDNDVIQNALFNLSDTAAYSMLVEDDRFVLDSYLYDYEAPSDDMEYYRITDNYFSMDEITEALVDKIQSEGSVMLRTDYELDDETFDMIAQDTANGAHANITGFHWMGVIRLEQK